MTNPNQTNPNMQISTDDADLAEAVEPPVVEENVGETANANAAQPPAQKQEQLPPELRQGTPTADQVPRGQTGVDGETDVWEGRYSFRNFVGRFLLRLVATVAFIGLAIYTWGGWRESSANDPMTYVAIGAGILVLAFWVYLVFQIIRARLSHYYRLTNRRLFVQTGILTRRSDQVELLEVEDVYVKQASLFHRWFSVGTVVVESSEQKMPTSYLVGVDDPQAVMDIIWHYARIERESSAVQVDQV